MQHSLKRAIAILTAAALVFVLAACGGSSGKSNTGGNGGGSSPSASQGGQSGQGGGSGGEKIVLRLGHWLTEESTQGKQYNNFARIVNEKSNGRIEVQVFPNGQLGNQRDLIEGVIAGTVDMTKADDAYLTTYIPAYGIFSLPFIFEDYDHLGKVLDSEITQELDKQLEEKTGLVSLGWSFGGFRYFTLKKAITEPDLQGMKIRVPESDVYVETIKLLNGNPVPMPWGEVYTGLETGVVEGMESAPSDIYLQKFFEVTGHLLATNHIQASATTVISKKKWESLSAEDQKLILDSMREAIEIERQETAQANEDAVKAMAEAGAQVHEVADKQAFIDKVKPLWDKVANDVNGQDIIDKIQSLK